MSQRWHFLVLAAATLIEPLSPVASAQQPELDKFLFDFRCDVLERLAYIHNHGDVVGRDRFLVVAIKNYPQRYVQCLFQDRDTKMLCEASSGFYASAPGEPRKLHVTSDKLKILGGLGFATNDDQGKYQVMLELGAPSDLLKVADLMLTTLFEVYGAWDKVTLTMKAPLVPEDAVTHTRCSQGT